MEEVQIAVEAAVWSELGETEEERIEQVLDAIDRMRKSDTTDVIEVEGLEPDVIPEIVAQSNIRFERTITGLAAMMGAAGCPCSKCRAKAAAGDDTPTFSIFFGKDGDKVRGEVDRKAAELGMIDGDKLQSLLNNLGGGVGRGIARSIAQALKTTLENGELQPGVNVLRVDAATGEISAVSMEEADAEGVGDAIREMIDESGVEMPVVTPAKRTIH